MEINPNLSENAKLDYAVVLKAMDGSQKAYADLMQRYKDPIFYMVVKMVNNKDDAMDITISTFAKAFENLEKYKPDFAFSTWLFKIATNSSIDFLRKRRLQTTSISDLTFNENEDQIFDPKSEDLNPEEFAIKKQQTEQLKEVLEKLPNRYKTLMVLRYFDQLSYDEIAIQLGIPIGTVKAQLFRARNLFSNIAIEKNVNNKSDF